MKKTGKPKFDQAAYVQQLDTAHRQLLATKQDIVSWVSQLDVFAASEFLKIEPLTGLFPCSKGGRSYRVILKIHTTPKRYGVLGVSLRADTLRTDLLKLTTGEVIGTLRQPLGLETAKIQAANFEHFRKFNERLAGLTSFGEEFSVPTKDGPSLPRWLKALEAYGQKCMGPVEAAFDEYIQITEALSEAMFDFNAAMGPVRYRSIRFTFSADEFDLLGPSKPSMKVVTSLHPLTGRRRYNEMCGFKKVLKGRKWASSSVESRSKPR